MKSRLSKELSNLIDGRRELKLGKLVNSLSQRGFGILFVLISLPSALPIPAAGYSIPFGLVIVLLGLQMILGQPRPWLPQRLCEREVPKGAVELLAKRGIPFLKKAERLLHPRLGVMNGVLLRPLIGLIALLMGGLMMIPIPGTNTLPGFTVFLLGLGLVGSDGLFILGGLVMGLVLVAIYLAFAISGGTLLRLLF